MHDGGGGSGTSSLKRRFCHPFALSHQALHEGAGLSPVAFIVIPSRAKVNLALAGVRLKSGMELGEPPANINRHARAGGHPFWAGFCLGMDARLRGHDDEF
jgi:hypothetical protein